MSVTINHEICITCGACVDTCAFDALEMVDGVVTGNPDLCESCGVCTIVCPEGAITLDE